MLRYQFKFFVLVVLFAMQMSGCSSSPTKAVWKDAAYTARPQKVVVIAVSKEPIYRRIIEDEFTLLLCQDRGIDLLGYRRGFVSREIGDT